jgi:HD-GYP domain-containing protein (c-di-GMP phosphodiesterase class II)
MKLAAPVSHPERSGQELLRSGYVLEDTLIRKMREMGIPFLYVDYPALDTLDKHLAAYLSPARQQILLQINSAITSTRQQTRAKIPYRDYCSTARELISTLMTQGQNPVYLEQMARQGGDAVGHAAAVAHLSLLMGLKLEEYLIDQRSRLSSARARDCVNLGVAGMLHDIGLSRLPERLAQFSDVDPPQDEGLYAEWKTHAEIGYQLIRNDCEATASASVYQHHQHYDGSGFPSRNSESGLRGPMDHNRIHVFARIILCANLFDRLISPVHGQPHRSNKEVHEIIRTKYAGWCDPAILRVLMSVAPPYPPGCRLKLTDGSRAVVIDVSSAAPLKPLVRRLAEDNWTPVGEPLDLQLPAAPQIAA